MRLLEVLSQQVAVVVHALDLAEALEAEKDRVLQATRAERSRLLRDLHDGLGSSLSGTGFGLVAELVKISV
jgi:signal transduction histidine kinase